MEKLFHFDSPEAHYNADACVISCIDARFALATRKFLKRIGIAMYDHIQIPGAAKLLNAPDGSSDRDFVCRMIVVSQQLHYAKRVLLLGHNDCGAYGGASVDVITGDVLRAAEFIRRSDPSLAVDCYFADFDGVYRIV
jgi:carbonic anhydrase